MPPTVTRTAFATVLALLLPLLGTDLSAQSLVPAARAAAGAFDQIPTPAGAPPTPRHTGIRALFRNLIHDFAHIPSKENLAWTGVGTAAALSVHPFDARVNRRLTGNETADAWFTPGKYLGQTYTLVGTAITIYAVGRIDDQPRVSHLGMDLLRALIVDEVLTETIKAATHRERPDHSNFKSFPSGHASTTFAFATALERHLGWRGAVPAYLLSSYVAASRLHDNRHYLSDVAFGAAVGVIAGRTVTRHGRTDYSLIVVPTRGGSALMVVRNNGR
ncbi:MAG: phosphatase PAP2 family protein [Vicinamibacterales bacterium]